MYTAIIGGHLGQTGFEAEVVRLVPSLVNATLDLHGAVANTFLPSATKFQYQFNLRELSAIAQVLRFVSSQQHHCSLAFQYSLSQCHFSSHCRTMTHSHAIA